MSDDEEYVYEDEDEEYVYSDADDVTTMDSGNVFHIPDGGFKLLDYKEVYPMMESFIAEIANLLGVSQDIAQVLLQQYKWNKERLVDGYYSDPEKAVSNAGAGQAISNPQSAESTLICRICGDEHDLANVYGLNCGHRFCRVCYGAYLNTQIKDGPSCMSTHCPEYKCKQSITKSVVEALCPAEVYDKYLMYLTRNFIETSSNMRWCPFPGCEKIAIGSGITTVRCACSLPFCFRCGSEAHDPATCSHLAMWQEKCQNESETANWILAHTKRCPKCNTRIEKNQGCNHMTCRMCKYDFCWICMGGWEEHGQNTGGYYKCNKYDPSANKDKNVEKAKAELDRYLHYYQRYHGHDSALKFASKQRENAEKKMVELQETERSAWIDVQFLKQAVEQVIECRRVLKYTYVLGHFLKDGTAEKELYEHHQEMLEKHTERLSELTEVDSPGLTEVDRGHVVNLTRITERFMNSMLSAMMDGGSSLSIDPATSTTSLSVLSDSGVKESTP